MQISAIQATKPNPTVRNKTQLKRFVDNALPTWRNVRILTDNSDSRSQGYNVAICEQDQHGKLTLLVGGPDLSTAAGFLLAAVEDGRIK